MTRRLRITPWHAHDAVARAMGQVGKGKYILGAGGRDPDAVTPWTKRNGALGSDCVGFVLWCWGIDRFQPSFPEYGGWINTDSAMREAERYAQWFERVTLSRALPGDLVVWGSRYEAGRRVRVGHVGLIVDERRVHALRADQRAAFHMLDVVHCSASGNIAVKLQPGRAWDAHNSVVLRVTRPVEAPP